MTYQQSTYTNFICPAYKEYTVWQFCLKYDPQKAASGMKS